MTAFPSELDSDYPLPICNTVQSYTLSKKNQEPVPERIITGGKCTQTFFNIRFASLGVMPANFQKNHPSGAPAILPIPIKQSAGGFCSPRSHREITIDEQLSRFPKAS